MASDEPSSAFTKRVLSKEDLEKLPNEIRVRYEEFFGEFLEMKALYETQRTSLDGYRSEFELKSTELTEKYQDEFAKAQSAHSLIDELRDQLETSRLEVSRMTETLKRYESELLEYRKDRNGVVDERDSLMKMVERRNFEVERLESDVKSLKQQLQAAINSKCEALSKYDEVQHKEVNLEFKEKRLEQERVLLQNQIEMLTTDLNRNIQELQKCRAESTNRTMTIEAKLHEKSEELNIATSQIAHLTESNASLNSRIEELSQQLLTHNDEFTKMMEKYQKELLAKDRLAELYKKKSEETIEEQRDIGSVVAELRATLREATEEFGSLETRSKQAELQHQQELEEKSKFIQELQEELKNANELLKAAQQENIDIAVERLCPTAAATSKLLKSGKSLTEIYTLYVNTYEELQSLSRNHEQLKLRFSEVIQEIQEKAPIVTRTEIELEKATEANNELQNQLEAAIRERVEIRHQSEELTVKVRGLETQTKELLRDRQDLSRQVCHLLQIIEQGRSSRDDSITSDMSGNEVISKRLVTFSDVQELQANNAQLLAVVRDLTAKIEEMDELKTHMDQATYEAKIENYTRRLQEMQENMELQTRMMEKCIAQREHYKKLYQEKGDDDENLTSASNTSLNSSVVDEKNKKIGDLETRIKDGEKELKTLKEEYENYRKEKRQNDEMMNKQFDSLRSELREVSTINCKLRAQVEHHDGQLKLQQKNIATYKKQIQTLEDRNKNYESTIVKHETAMAFLRDDAMNSAAKLSRAEILVEKLTQESRMLKDSESRLKAEREVLYRERQSNSLVLNNLEMIKTTMERSENEGKMRMETRLDELTRECSALRRRLQEEQDRFRELSTNLERDTQKAKDRMEEEKALATKYQTELVQAREDIEKKAEKIDQLSKKLQESLTPTQDDNPVAQANKLRKEMEMKLNEALVEKEQLEKELTMSKEHAKQYCDMAENYEKQLTELNEVYTEYKSRVETDLQQTKKSEANLKQKVNDLETEISLDINNRQLMAGDSSTQLHKAQLDLKEALTKIAENNRELRELREKSTSLAAAVEAAEQKYANEMILHSSDIKTMARLKEETNAIRQQFEQLRLAREHAEEKFESGKKLWTDQEANFLKEKSELEERVSDLDKQNSALHNQIQELSRMNVSIDEENPNVSVSEDKSSEQLLQVIKYLRKEKDIAVAKFDILRNENIRLKSEMQLLVRKLEESQESSLSKGEQSDVASLNSLRHEELLRKVETLNAITDSNRILREERDSLAIKYAALQERVAKVEDELIPLQERNREFEVKNESLTTENVSLRTEATRWRQRANALLERSNKNSPDDWKRLQTERENLAKMLQAEKDALKKANEELTTVKQEKSKLDSEIANIQRQMTATQAEVKKLNEENTQQRQSSAKMSQELLELKVKFDGKDEDLKRLSEELNSKEQALNALKEKEIQIRKIAKRYKDQFLELKEKVDSGAPPADEVVIAGESSNATDQVQQLQAEIDAVRMENGTLQQQCQELRTQIAKEESCKTLLLQAKTKMTQMTEKREQLTRELTTTKTQLDQRTEEHEQVIRNLKSQYEARIQRLEKEIGEHAVEKSDLMQRFNQLRAGQSSKPATSTMEKGTTDASSRTANVKPMAGPSQQSATVQPWRGSGNTGETPLASIRPISLQNSRTVAVMPTTNVQPTPGASTASVTALVPPQQQVHTTGEAISSSHTDYMPATSSATVVVAAITPMGSSQAESSSQSQEVEAAPPSESQVVTQAAVAQAVALVSPRVEAPQVQSVENQAPSTSGGVTLPPPHHQASSSNTVTTTGINKRSRDVEGDSSTSNDDASEQKRPRVQEGTFQVGVSESGLEVEYQVPTSSQRDQEDDAIVLSSEDEEDEDDEAMPDEGIENDGIETDYQEMDDGPDIDLIQNNEVEVEDVSEVPEQSEPEQPQNQQQIQSISSGSNGGDDAGPSTSQWRQSPNASTSRQQAQQLMLMSQTFQDEASDDRIVPSTPTLYRSRNDGFSEVSSPHPAQVPHTAARFTFGESSSRPMVEGMDETRIDLEQGMVPTMPQQQQPSPGDVLINDSTSASTSSSSSISTVIQQDLQQEQQPVAGSSQEEGQVPEISVTDDDYDGASTSEARDETGNILEPQDTEEGGDGVSSEGEKLPATESNEDDTSEADMLEQPQNLRTTRSGGIIRGSPSPPSRGRIMRGQRGNRIQPIVWNQDMQQQMMSGQNRQQQPFPSPPTRGSQRARRGARGRGAASSNYGNNMRY